MKYSGAKAKSYLKSGEAAPLTLIFSESTARARDELRKLAQRELGDNAQTDMRWQEFDARDAQKDATLILDAMKEVSFFPGPRGVLVFAATDALSKNLETALEDFQSGDAKIFVQAGNLKASSKLRKTFEPHPQSVVIGLYDDPISPQEIQELLQKHGLRLSEEARAAFIDFASSAEAGTIEPLLEMMSLYQGDDTEPMALETLYTLLPGQMASAADEIVNLMFRGDAKRLVQEIRLAPAQGISLAEINMRAIWRAKMIFDLKSSDAPSQALQKLRPPVFGARRQALEDNLRRWSAPNAELALSALAYAEKEIRSGQNSAPERAYLERVFLRVAMRARN